MATTQETLDSTKALLERVKTEGVTNNAGQYQPFSAESLNKALTSAQLPTVPTDNFDYRGTIAAGTAMAGSSQTQDNGMADLFKQYIGEQSAPPSTADAYSAAYDESGKGAAQQQVNDLSAQLNDINAQAQSAMSTLESQSAGKDVTTQFLGKQQQEVSRQLAIKSLPLQAQLSAAQGNLQMATDKLNTLYQLKSQDATNQYNYKMKLIDSVYDFATKREQAKLDAKRLADEQAFTLQRDQLAREHDVAMANLNASLKPVATTQGNGAVDANGNIIADPAKLGVINDVNTIIDDPALLSTFGWGNILKRNIPGSPEAYVKAQVNNLMDKLALAARGQLKGQGTVSDYEGKMLKNAQTALKLNMESDQAMQQLLNIRGAIATSSGLTATVEIKDLATGITQIMTSNQAGISQAIQDGLLVTYK